jgi:tetratricopeptide (TPR) repeat protein
MRIRLTPTLVAAALFAVINLPAAGQSQSAVEFKTTNEQAVNEFKVGIAHMQYASADEASTHFAAAFKADPNFGLARVNWALTANLPTAQRDAEIDRGVADAAAHGSDGELIMATAIRELAYGRPNVSAALFRAASLLRPSDRLAEFASMLDLSGKEAIAARRELVKRHPDYALTYNQLAFDLWNAGDRSGALAAAKKQIELDSTASNPHDSYAHLLQWNGDFDAAKAHYLRAVSLPSPYPGSYGGLAEIAALQGKYDEARSYLNRAIAASYTPFEKLRYMRQIAGIQALQGEPDALTRQLEAVADAAKTDDRPDVAAEAYAQIAAVQAMAGRVDAAHKYVASAKAAAPVDSWWPNYYAAVAHSELKHWAPANVEISALKAKAAKNGNVSGAHIAAAEGFLLSRQGKADEALKVLMAADTTNFIVINRIAEAHAALGHTAESVKWNKRITDNYAVELTDFPGVNARRRARQENEAARR